MRYSITIAALCISVAITSRLVLAQTSDSKSSSLGSLNSNALLGDSFKSKDFGKLPTNITSDTLTLNAKTRVFVYKGNVVVTQGDMTLTSKEIEGNYSEQNQIQKVIAIGDVVITKQDIRATSQKATYDAVNSVIILTDNPQLQQGESVLIADRIKILLNENRSLAEGNVRVTFVKTDGVTPVPTAAGTPAVSSPAASTSATPSTPTAAPKTAIKATPQPTAKNTAAPRKAATTKGKGASIKRSTKK